MGSAPRRTEEPVRRKPARNWPRDPMEELPAETAADADDFLSWPGRLCFFELELV